MQRKSPCPLPVAIFAVRRMDIRFEQRVNIKFYVKLGKRATETLQLLHDAYSDGVSSTTLRPRGKATWEYRGYSSSCDVGAHRHSERGIHQLLSGLAQTLATVYWLQRELLWGEQEAVFVRLNFVFFTDSVSELKMHGQQSIKVSRTVVCLF
jgi:hypothetical protein